MQTVIFVGGKGTRIAEETRVRPKPLVSIGDRPIIQHILDSFIQQGYAEFILLTGYMASAFEDYFDARSPLEKINEPAKTTYRFSDCRVILLDTGEDSPTGIRLKLALPHIEGTEFFLTYGDGLCSVDLASLLKFHRSSTNSPVATVTAVRPAPRFGVLSIDDSGCVRRIREKSIEDAPIINGGFMVINRQICDYLSENTTSLEGSVLPVLAERGVLNAYYHAGFWQCMDTLAEKKLLAALWETGDPPWCKKD